MDLSLSTDFISKYIMSGRDTIKAKRDKGKNTEPKREMTPSKKTA